MQPIATMGSQHGNCQSTSGAHAIHSYPMPSSSPRRHIHTQVPRYLDLPPPLSTPCRPLGSDMQVAGPMSTHCYWLPYGSPDTSEE